MTGRFAAGHGPDSLQHSLTDSILFRKRAGPSTVARYISATTGDRHQTPAHIIVPDDGQQAAGSDADLLAKRPPDNEQRFD